MRNARIRTALSAAWLACLLPRPCAAQAGANAVASARDAFGFRSGDDMIGVYDETFVRGFSPETSGNYRFNGAYFVRNSGTSHFFVDSATVRVGFNVLAEPLPSASGLIDYRLRDPVPGERSNLTLGADAYGQYFSDLHYKGAADDGSASISLGLSRIHKVRDAQGGKAGGSWLGAGSARWTRGAWLGRLFFGEYEYERPAQFKIRAQGSEPPAELTREKPVVPQWATDRGQRRIAGSQIEWSASPSAGLRQTLVWSQEDPSRTYSQIMRVGEDRWEGVLLGMPEQQSQSVSTEIDAFHRRGTMRIDYLLRARRSSADYGGGVARAIAASGYGEPATDNAWFEASDDTPQDHSEVRQIGTGFAVGSDITKTFSTYAGIMRSRYAKSVDPAFDPPRKRTVWETLGNAGATWQPTARVWLFAAAVKALEEAGVAPASATNRNEILDAIVVRQREFGAKAALREGWNLLGSVFEIEKPYAGIDPANSAFREIGTVRHRGLEASLSGLVTPSTKLVLGGVLLRARVASAMPDGAPARPVGVPNRRAIIGVDHAIAALPGLSTDFQLIHQGRRAAALAINPGGNQLDLPSYTTLNLGLRYRRELDDAVLTLRWQVLNATDEYHWDPAGGETLTYSAPRRTRILLTYEFQ
jgi:iron complex outermembrane receptor protein